MPQDNYFDSVGKRVRFIRKQLFMNQQEFASLLGIGKSAVSMIETGHSSLSVRNRNVFIQLLNISPEWLDGGLGEVHGPIVAPSPSRCKAWQTDTGTLSTLRAKAGYAVWHRGIPLYTLGEQTLLSAVLGRRSTRRPVDYVYVPDAPSCDGALRIRSDNMAPRLHNGDIVLFRRTPLDAQLLWGEVYLLVVAAGHQQSLWVGTLQPAMNDAVRVVNGNPYYADRVLPRSDIRALALVKVSIHVSSTH